MPGYRQRKGIFGSVRPQGEDENGEPQARVNADLKGAQGYLDECSYSIDLEAIYKIGVPATGDSEDPNKTNKEDTGTCAYNA